ncbi:MAG: hypothetical protein ABI822_11795 [Bryobacteraceae bacterium]
MAALQLSHSAVSSTEMIFRATFFPVGSVMPDGFSNAAMARHNSPALMIRLWNGQTLWSLSEQAMRNMQALLDVEFPVNCATVP